MDRRETESLRSRAEVFKALGHPTRLWIVERLAEGACCVADLAEGVDGGLSAVSQHLAQLRQAGIVRDERRGRQVWYSLTFPCVAEMAAMLDGRAARQASPLGRLRRVLGVLAVLAGVGLSVGVGACLGGLGQDFAPRPRGDVPRAWVAQHTQKGMVRHEASTDIRRRGVARPDGFRAGMPERRVRGAAPGDPRRPARRQAGGPGGDVRVRRGVRLPSPAETAP